MELSGAHNFDNSDAREWAEAYRQMGLPVAASTLEVALGDFEASGLTPDIGFRAIAAVEAVAFALGRGSVQANEHFAGAPSADSADAQALLPDCIRFIDAISGGPDAVPPAPLAELRGRLKGEAPVAAETPVAPESQTRVQSEPIAMVAEETDMEDIRLAIANLSSDVDALRRDMANNFARLAQMIGGQK